MEYFELFDLPVGFNIDQKLLNRTYIQLQKKYHPDFFGQASEEERAFALETSSLVNKAYKTLKDKDLTLQYFLQQKNLIEDGEPYKLPPDFLLEVMDLNELKMDGAPPEEVMQKAMEMETALLDDIRELLDNYKDSAATESDLLRIKDYYYKKKYIDRLLAK